VHLISKKPRNRNLHLTDSSKYLTLQDLIHLFQHYTTPAGLIIVYIINSVSSKKLKNKFKVTSAIKPRQIPIIPSYSKNVYARTNTHARKYNKKASTK